MGLDFIKRARPTFEKSWSRGLKALSEPDFFNCAPGEPSKVLIANLSTTAADEGEELIALSDGTRIALTQGVTQVGCIEDAPVELVSQIDEMGGFAYAKIDRVNSLSETAEVRIWRWDSDEEN
jgi:hypothetical protein